MPDDPIDRLRRDLKEGMAELRADFSKVVSRELHDAQLERLRDQVNTVARDLDRLDAAVKADREAAKRRRETLEERRAADRRITKGAVATAITGIILQILNSAGVLP